mmetsp:Transcript_80459/g.172162  ORF Transcript_80459/g.172162 Transcript_80459/m.172162 type:complete len:80 (+) Transcript_80459:1538-1777(+)
MVPLDGVIVPLGAAGILVAVADAVTRGVTLTTGAAEAMVAVTEATVDGVSEDRPAAERAGQPPLHGDPGTSQLQRLSDQ